MRSVTVQVGTRVSETDDCVPVLVSISDDGPASPEWVETTARMAGDEACRVVDRIMAMDDDVDDAGTTKTKQPPGAPGP